MKTFLIFVLTAALLAVACLTRPRSRASRIT